MKNLSLPRHWLIFGLITLLALSACERPIPRPDDSTTPDVAPTTEVIIVPTVAPDTGSAETGTAPAAGETGDTAAGSGETGTEAATGETAESTGESSSETPADTTTEAEQPTVDAGGEVIHVVQAGETLGQIAQFYKVTIEDIAAANGIVDVDSLEVGQELVIKAGAAGSTDSGEETPAAPGGEQIHVVQAGENLFRIGLRYGFTAEELAAYNNIPDITRIDIGQIIKIPPK